MLKKKRPSPPITPFASLLSSCETPFKYIILDHFDILTLETAANVVKRNTFLLYISYHLIPFYAVSVRRQCVNDCQLEHQNTHYMLADIDAVAVILCCCFRFNFFFALDKHVKPHRCRIKILTSVNHFCCLRRGVMETLGGSK